MWDPRMGPLWFGLIYSAHPKHQNQNQNDLYWFCTEAQQNSFQYHPFREDHKQNNKVDRCLTSSIQSTCLIEFRLSGILRPSPHLKRVAISSPGTRKYIYENTLFPLVSRYAMTYVIKCIVYLDIFVSKTTLTSTIWVKVGCVC